MISFFCLSSRREFLCFSHIETWYGGPDTHRILSLPTRGGLSLSLGGGGRRTLAKADPTRLGDASKRRQRDPCTRVKRKLFRNNDNASLLQDTDRQDHHFGA